MAIGSGRHRWYISDEAGDFCYSFFQLLALLFAQFAASFNCKTNEMGVIKSMLRDIVISDRGYSLASVTILDAAATNGWIFGARSFKLLQSSVVLIKPAMTDRPGIFATASESDLRAALIDAHATAGSAAVAVKQ